jgi:hypothetical protein
MSHFAALETALQNILAEVDGKADASREPGEEREHANDYMRIQGEADTALAEVKRLSNLISDGTKWIPASERLPKYGETVLGWEPAARDHSVVMFHGARALLSCAHATQWADCHGEWVDVSHWMPLPEAPK